MPVHLLEIWILLEQVPYLLLKVLLHRFHGITSMFKDGNGSVVLARVQVIECLIFQTRFEDMETHSLGKRCVHLHCRSSRCNQLGVSVDRFTGLESIETSDTSDCQGSPIFATDTDQ